MMIEGLFGNHFHNIIEGFNEKECEKIKRIWTQKCFNEPFDAQRGYEWPKINPECKKLIHQLDKCIRFGNLKRT